MNSVDKAWRVQLLELALQANESGQLDIAQGLLAVVSAVTLKDVLGPRAAMRVFRDLADLIEEDDPRRDGLPLEVAAAAKAKRRPRRRPLRKRTT